MTSSEPQEDLGLLIDRVFAGGAWIELKLFMRPDGLGAFVVMREKGSQGYRCDQVTDPSVPPSVRIRTMLKNKDPGISQPSATIPVDKYSNIQQNVDNNTPEPANDFDDLLG